MKQADILKAIFEYWDARITWKIMQRPRCPGRSVGKRLIITGTPEGYVPKETWMDEAGFWPKPKKGKKK